MARGLLGNGCLSKASLMPESSMRFSAGFSHCGLRFRAGPLHCLVRFSSHDSDGLSGLAT